MNAVWEVEGRGRTGARREKLVLLKRQSLGYSSLFRMIWYVIPSKLSLTKCCTLLATWASREMRRRVVFALAVGRQGRTPAPHSVPCAAVRPSARRELSASGASVRAWRRRRSSRRTFRFCHAVEYFLLKWGLNATPESLLITLFRPQNIHTD